MSVPVRDTTEIAPRCSSCTRRHSPELPCWVGRLVKKMFALVVATYGDVCCHCHRPGSDSVEHVRPRSMWGTDDLDNLRPAHTPCNSGRGTRPMVGWSDQPTTSRAW